MAEFTWTQYTEVNRILEEIMNDFKAIWEDKFLGFYLYGSLVWGDFDMKTSDIDTLCVIKSEINSLEFKQLKQKLEILVRENPRWNNRIEIHIAPLNGIRNFRRETFKMGNISPGEPLHIIDSGGDWIDEWYCVQEYAVPLFGMRKEEVIPPIEKREFIQTITKYALSFEQRIETCKDSCYAQAYAILTLCRALYTRRNGEQVSKPAAAKWAMDYVPEYSELIQEALIWRQERDQCHRNSYETYELAEKFVKDMCSRFFRV